MLFLFPCSLFQLILLISFIQNKCLETDINYHLPSTKIRQKPVVTVFTLQPKNFVEVSGVCESVLYGLPRVLKPTSCWKMEWDELEKNQSQFVALNSYLSDKVCAYYVEILAPQLILYRANKPISYSYEGGCASTSQGRI